MKILIYVVDAAIVLCLAALASLAIWTLARAVPQPGANLSELSAKMEALEKRTIAMEKSALAQGEAIRKRLEKNRKVCITECP